MNTPTSYSNRYQLIASVVIFHNSLDMLTELVDSFFHSAQQGALRSKLVFIDNSTNSQFRRQLQEWVNLQRTTHQRDIVYWFAGFNRGFGAAHNLAIQLYGDISEYFLILNPDIKITPSCLPGLYEWMQQHPSIHLCAPKILNSDGSLQFVHKRHPTLTALFARRFIPQFLQTMINQLSGHWLQRQLDQFILQDFLPFQTPLAVPMISGCFMWFRSTTLLQQLKGFDERFFMYMEDFDLSRRSLSLGSNVVLWHCEVYHRWARGSHHQWTLTLITIYSIAKYFWKWRGQAALQPHPMPYQEDQKK